MADKVLPAVAPHTLDAANDVRKEAFNVVDIILVGLRAESQKMAKDEAERISAATCGMSALGEDGATSGCGGGGGIPAPSSSGYLSGLSTWMTTTATTTSQPAETTPRPTVAGKTLSVRENGLSMPSSTASSPKPGPTAPKFSSLSLSDAQIGGASSSYSHAHGTSGGWSDDDDDIGISSSPTKGKGGGGWDDDDDLGSPGKKLDDDSDFFASFGSSPAPAASSRSIGASRLPASSHRTGLSLTSKAAPQIQATGVKIKKQAKPAVQKISGTDILDDGWDDF
jgi:SCY1-like protein 1